MFRGAPPDCQAIGELSHDYLFSVDAAERIRRDLPGVKLLTCLRNPMERTFSHYLALVRAGMTRDPFERALDGFPELIDHSLYSRHLQVYLERFEPSQLKVLCFETLTRDPRKFAEGVFDYLGIPPAEHIDYTEKFNEAAMPRSFLLARLSKWGANLARDLSFPRVVGYAKRSPLRHLLYRDYVPGNRPVMSDAAKQRLQETFAPEVERLEKLLGFDCSRWLTTTPGEPQHQ